jgi:uncharacterized membrane protein YebE (DUF533 family)
MQFDLHSSISVLSNERQIEYPNYSVFEFTMCKGYMMKTAQIISGLLATGLIALIPVSTFAQEAATPNITKRQIQQQKRIADGVRSGELTAKETANLELREAKIQADKRAAKADGVVTDAERAKLHAQENRTSRKIYRKKHNDRDVH